MEKRAQRLEWIDSFKAFAMLGVFAVHCGRIGLPQFSNFWRYGNRGVELFFIITGYLACTRLPEERSLKGCHWIAKKYIRIMPLAIFTYIVSFLFNFVVTESELFNSLTWFYKNRTDKNLIVSIIVSLTPFSFISTQEINSYVGMYFLVNILFYLYLSKIVNKKIESVTMCAVSIVVMYLISVFVPFLTRRLLLNESLWIHFFETKIRAVYSFMIGIVLYNYEPFFKSLGRKDKQISNCVHACMASIITAILYGCWYYDRWNTVSIMLLVSLVIACNMIMQSKVFVNKVFASIGRYSYAFYYAHIPVVFSYIDGLAE